MLSHVSILSQFLWKENGRIQNYGTPVVIDWLGSLDSLGSVRGSTLSTLLWFYASVIISNVYLVCNSAAWYLWCIAPDSLKCLGIPNSFPMHLRSYLELGWFKSFFCLANFTNHFDITTLEMEYRGGGMWEISRHISFRHVKFKGGIGTWEDFRGCGLGRHVPVKPVVSATFVSDFLQRMGAWVEICVHRFVIDMLHNVAISDICHNAVSAFLKQDTYGLMHEDMLNGIRENTPHSE